MEGPWSIICTPNKRTPINLPYQVQITQITYQEDPSPGRCSIRLEYPVSNEEVKSCTLATLIPEVIENVQVLIYLNAQTPYSLFVAGSSRVALSVVGSIVADPSQQLMQYSPLPNNPYQYYAAPFPHLPAQPLVSTAPIASTPFAGPSGSLSRTPSEVSVSEEEGPHDRKGPGKRIARNRKVSAPPSKRARVSTRSQNKVSPSTPAIPPTTAPVTQTNAAIATPTTNPAEAVTYHDHGDTDSSPGVSAGTQVLLEHVIHYNTNVIKGKPSVVSIGESSTLYGLGPDLIGMQYKRCRQISVTCSDKYHIPDVPRGEKVVVSESDISSTLSVVHAY
ncbi:hypothetical protein ONZ45_g9502 [Pleurotus djamor]|nr:hypothetical protein ONZ45_g9502 [Pleurotus djamor]